MFMRNTNLLTTLETIEKFYKSGILSEDYAVKLIDSRIRQDNIEKEIENLKRVADDYRRAWKR